jgi:hypothetical protein
MQHISQKDQFHIEKKEQGTKNTDAEQQAKKGRDLLRRAQNPEQFEQAAQYFSDAITKRNDKAEYWW